MRRMYSQNQLENAIINGAEQVVESAVESAIDEIDDYLLPEFPETVESKTYVLQLVNGVLTWVEVE